MSTHQKFFLLIVGVLVGALIPLAFVGAQLPGRGDTYPYCLQYDSDTEYHVIPCPDDPTPTKTPMPTWTPSATNTPVVAATDTPTPEPSPTLEDTRTPTYTPPPSATPTATLTPTPSPTPDPSDVHCYGTTTVNLNFRDEPGGNRIGTWSAGQRLEVLDVRYIFDGSYLNEYGLLTNSSVQGWSAVYYRGAEYFEFEPTEDCLLVRFGEGPAVTIHTIIWTDRAKAIDFQTGLTHDADIVSGTKNYVSEDICRTSLANRHMCIQRWPPDCSPNIGASDPAAAANAYMDARNGGVQALASEFGADNPLLIIELTNECLIEGQADWWNTWLIAAVDYAVAHNWPAIAVLGLGPGNGSYEFFKGVREGLQYVYDHGGYLSVHAYEPVEHCQGDGSLANGSIWCAYRHRLTYYWLDQLGVDVRILITELAPGWGDTQVTQDVVNDFGIYYCKVKNDPGLYAISPWIFGPHQSWIHANLEGWGAQLVRSFATCGAG